ncbi:ABC transporter permease [Nesterenkonia salmonea]|uniref:ABC transporter permease n=1 Tax=Nesterenkonia salmonea TaxID=1804987 RepID=UPI001FB61729|nr:ABC transporter permease [Nesterenkonia salmonea]
MVEKLQGLKGSPWLYFLSQKLLELIVAFVVLVAITFLIVLLIPGDPARVIAGPDASQEHIEFTRQRLDLDLPVWQQFWNYLSGIFTGDLGQSFRTNEEVWNIVAIRLPFTVTIALGAIVVAFIGAIILGMTVAGLTRGNRNRWLDVTFSWASATLQAFPTYVYGAILVAIFAVALGWLPAGGASNVQSYILPIAALSFGAVFSVARIVRRETANVLEMDYMRTARGWRISRLKQYVKYALPNLMASTLTLSGLIFANMIGGAVVIESVFAWPGLGNGVVGAILDRDYPVIRGIILTIGVFAIMTNTMIDIVLAAFDPRTLTAGKAFS